MKPWHRLARMLAALGLGVTNLRAWVPLTQELWPNGTVAIAFDLGRTAPRGSVADWDSAAQQALDLWNARLERVQLARVPLESEAWYENGRNEIFFDRNEFDDPFPSDALAVSFASYDHGVKIENDIIFNANFRWTVSIGPNRSAPWDFRRVVVHELGHLLGLNHPDEAGQTVSAIMNARESDIEAPTADDVAGVRALYDWETKVAPTIVVAPKPAEVVEGESVRLAVLAGGRGPLAYEWRRDGAAVPGATSSVHTFLAALSDAGAYTVIVSNAAGPTTSVAVRVTVRAAIAPELASNGGRWDAVTGSDLTLGQAAMRGDPPLRYEWRKNGVIIPGATKARLLLQDLQFSDSGDYVETVRNAGGSASSSVVQLRVSPPLPLRFPPTPTILTAAPLQTVQLNAPVDRTLVSRYQWLRNGVEIPGAVTETLVIENFQAGDAGEYSLRVSNSFGVMTRVVAEISGLARAPFSILRQPEALDVTLASAATFAVETDATAPRYQWFRNGQPIAGATGRVFTIASAGYRDRGQYAVEVTQGETRARSSSARLAVRQGGDLIFLAHPATHTVVAGTEVVLAAAASFVPGDAAATDRPLITYQWLKDGALMPGRTEMPLRFVASAETAGRYVVRAIAGATSIDSEEAEVVSGASPGLLSAHPRSELFAGLTEEMRLIAINNAIVLRRAGIDTIFYSRDGTRIADSPYASEEKLPGTYTLTLGRGGVTETSRPFTLGYTPGARPEITRHPVGAAVEPGAPVTLQVGVRPDATLSYRWNRDGEFLVATSSNEFRIDKFLPFHVGSYNVEVRNAAGKAWSESATLGLRGVIPPVFRLEPSDLVVDADKEGLLVVATWRPGFRYQWFKDGRAIPEATLDRFSVAGSSAAGDYWVVVTDGTETGTSRTARVTTRPAVRPPEIVMAPVGQAATLGGDIVISVGADGAPLPTQYQWRKDGKDVPGATDVRLRLHNVTADAAGSYTVVVTNAAGSVTSAPVKVTVDAQVRLINLATRAAVGRGANILIAGFVIDGAEQRQVLVRGIGDQLSEFGVSGVLRDPVVSLFDGKGALIGRNDDWFRSGADAVAALQDAARQAGAFPQRSDARDGALLTTLAPGSYTAQVTGLANTTGIALVEIYELGVPSRERLVNLSSRAVVGAGANLLIPGFVLSGEEPRRVLLRAVGPGLADFGVAGALADPIMTVYRGATVVASNDDWERQANASQLPPAMAAVGAFPLKNGSRDAALLLDLPAGSYTVQVAGVRDTTGVALVEVYEMKP